MTCPHCKVAFHNSVSDHDIGGDKEFGNFRIFWQTCPTCGRMIIQIGKFGAHGIPRGMFVAYPGGATSREPLSPDVPEPFASDYIEACLVLSDSAKASAALSRRCLQSILREKGGVKHQDLSREIDEILSSKQLPPHLANSIDAVRQVGNFAAHPIKSTSTGSIVEVEPGEAEWLLDVLEGMFQFFFVGPAETERKRDALNKKLADAGKPPMK